MLRYAPDNAMQCPPAFMRKAPVGNRDNPPFLPVNIFSFSCISRSFFSPYVQK
jgi:hypothetical protein